MRQRASLVVVGGRQPVCDETLVKLIEAPTLPELDRREPHTAQIVEVLTKAQAQSAQSVQEVARHERSRGAGSSSSTRRQLAQMTLE